MSLGRNLREGILSGNGSIRVSHRGRRINNQKNIFGAEARGFWNVPTYFDDF